MSLLVFFDHFQKIRQYRKDSKCVKLALVIRVFFALAEGLFILVYSG